MTGLKLQRHAHTGKLLPHHHTSYRALALLLLLTGGLIVGADWSMQRVVQADDLVVSARVAAPIPSSPAVIEQPKDGSTTTDPIITMSGSCPVVSPAVNVAIYDNGQLLGSVVCSGNGTFSLQVTLTAGKNTLIAKTVTITNDYGPDSAPITVTYQPATPPAASPAIPENESEAPSSSPSGEGEAGTGQPGVTQPLRINSKQTIITFGLFKDAEWTGSISGGQPPYKVTIDWGDGTTETYKKLGTEDRTFSHHYTKMHAYTVKIQATDAAGTRAIAEYAAVTPNISPSFVTPYANGGANTLTYIAIYSAYLGSLSLTGVLWLGAHHAVTTGAALAKAPVATHTTANRPTTRRPRRK